LTIHDSGYGHLVKRVETFNAVGVDEIYIKSIDEKKVVRNYTCCDIATWASETSPILKCVGEPRMLNLGMGDETHIHSIEREAKQWWEWLNIPGMIARLTAEQTNELIIGIYAHALDNFNLVQVKIESSGGGGGTW